MPITVVGQAAQNLYSKVFTYTDDASNQSFSSTTFADISGMGNQEVNLIAGKTYIFTLSLQLRTTGAGGVTEFRAQLNFDNGDQTVEFDDFVKMDTALNEQWETMTLTKKATMGANRTNMKLQGAVTASSTGIAFVDDNHPWTVTIIEESA